MFDFNSTVRYSEVDQNLELDEISLTHYFQDCSIFHSESLGVGVNYLSERNRSWLLSSWQIEVKRYPKLLEDIRIATWPYRFDSIYGYRNFLMTTKDGEVLAYANSIWIYVDTLSGMPQKLTPDITDLYPLVDAPYDMEYAARKIRIPKELENREPFPVVSSNIDSNHHVNNGEYIRMASEFLPREFKSSSFRAEYRKQAELGDTIFPQIYEDQEKYLVTLNDSDMKPYSIIEFYK